MIAWLYKWLPIIFGCHCRADRSFYYKGRQFPICARCTGELVGMLIAAVVCFFYLPPVWVTLVLMVPMVADGTIQLLTRYESTNPRRLATGILFGYAFMALLVIYYAACVRFGYGIGQNLR